jgi:hypothetical protein
MRHALACAEHVHDGQLPQRLKQQAPRLLVHTRRTDDAATIPHEAGAAGDAAQVPDASCPTRPAGAGLGAREAARTKTTAFRLAEATPFRKHFRCMAVVRAVASR